MITRTATNGTLPRRPAAAAVTGWPDQYVIWHPSGAGTYADRAGGRPGDEIETVHRAQGGILNITQSTDDQLMCIAAVRYCLGRRSYIVGSCLDWLQVHWPQFERKTQLVILRDIIEALMDDNAGSPSIDAPRWRTFAAWAWEQTDPQAQDWTRRAVSHKDGAWPLDEEQKSESRRVEP